MMSTSAIQSLFPVDVFIHAVLVTSASVLASRFVLLSAKECVLVGATAGVLSTAHYFSDLKKRVAILTVLAMAYFGAVIFAPILKDSFSVEVAASTIGKIVACNIFGQLVAFTLPKRVFNTPWNYSDSQIEDLSKDMEKFLQLSPIEQQLTFSRFKKLGLDVSRFTPACPCEKEIDSLTDAQVRILHDQCVLIIKYLDSKCVLTNKYLDPKIDALYTSYLGLKLNLRLILRYFHLNLSFRYVYSRHIKYASLPIPKTVKEIEQLSQEKITWFKEFFLYNDDAIRLLLYEIQWAFYQRGCINNYFVSNTYLRQAPPEQIHHMMQRGSEIGWLKMDREGQLVLVERCYVLGIDYSWKLHPQTAKEVQELSIETVKLYHQYLSPSNHTEEAMKAFIDRFDQLNLSIPNALRFLTSVQS